MSTSPSTDGTSTSRSRCLTPKPVQSPSPADLVRRLGFGPIRRAAAPPAVLVASPRHGIAELQEHFRIYDEAACEVGFKPAERPVIRQVFVADTKRRGEKIAAPAVTYLYRELYGAKSAQGERVLRNDQGEIVTTKDQVDFDHFKARYIIGDPELTFGELERYRSELGATELICWMHLPGIRAKDTMRSVELFAREVIPAFKDGTR